MSTAVAAATTTTTNREALNAAKPETLADHLRNMEFGNLLRGQLSQQLRRMVPVTDPVSPSGTAVQTIKLANHGKASRILRAYCRAGGGGIPGEFTPDAGAYAAPASQHVAIQPNGDICVLTADAVTDIDVQYEPERGELVVLPTLPVVGNAIAIPSAYTTAPSGVVLLLSAAIVTGTGTAGPLRINKPASANATNGTACLDLAKANVLFSTGGDAVLTAQFTLLVCAVADLQTYLSAQAVLL